MVNYTPPASDIIELKKEIKKLKEQLESETLAKNEGAEIVAELEVEIKEKETQRIELMTRLNDVHNENHALEIENTKLKELLKKANKFLKDYGFTFDGKDCAEAFKVHTKINQEVN